MDTNVPGRNKENTIGMLEARRDLTRLVGVAHFQGQRTILTVHGKEYGAIIGPEDLAILRSYHQAKSAEIRPFGAAA